MRKILVLAASPKDKARLRLDQEVRDIGEGLKRSRRRDDFDLVSQWAVRPRDLQRAMLEELPQIVHFSGHGGEDGLFLEDLTGKAQQVSILALANLFELFAEEAQIECVVLNGCYSKEQAEAIAQHVPYVIGMPQTVSDRAAIEFSVGFYDALANGRPVEFAFKLGKVAMGLTSPGAETMPVLVAGKTNPEDHPAPSPAPSAAADSSDHSPQFPLGNGGGNPEDGALRVFIAYSHHDQALKDELEVHLAPLKRKGKIQPWAAGSIEAGLETTPLIAAQLNGAKIILLLVTPQFMASDDIFETQLPQAMERHRAGTARVIPIRLKPVDAAGAEFEGLRPLPSHHQKPITLWNNRDEAFVEVVRGIRQVVEALADPQ